MLYTVSNVGIHSTRTIQTRLESHVHMFPFLYLDTARLGRMCPEAQAADRDFARLAGEEGCSLYFEHFLRWGFSPAAAFPCSPLSGPLVSGRGCRPSNAI